MVASAVVVDALRSPVGRRGGTLADVHPVDLAATVLASLVARADVDPALVDDVILGCVSQVGEQAFNLGRNVALAAGLPDSVPGTTIDRQCGSGQQAIHFAAQGVMAGAYDLVVAGGVEHMSRVPLGEAVVAAGSLPFRHGAGDPFGAALHARYPALVPQGVAAEVLAQRHGLSRAHLDEFARRSHDRAARAHAEGRFTAEVVPVPAGTGVCAADETIRVGIDAGELAAYPPAFQPGGMVTAANSASIADGAAVALIASEETAARRGLTVRARFRSFAVAAVDPMELLTAPVPATRRALERAKLTLDDVDLVEAHESFASTVLAWESVLGVHPDRVNVNGGAIALGHPLGASGARMLATLVHELERRDAHVGLQVMSEGGGTANALVVERP